MTFNIHLHIYVKFRAFGITFGTVNQGVFASYDGNALRYGEEKPSEKYQHKLYDNSGVKLELTIG